MTQGNADHSTVDLATVAGVERFIMSVQARGTKAGQKVLIIAHIAGLGAIGTTTMALLVRRGETIAGAQVGESVIVAIPGAVNEEAAAIWTDNAATDDPTYTIGAAIVGAAATIVNASLAILPIG